MNTEGYKSKEYGQPTKRFVQTMQLKDDSELMKEYRKAHDKDHFWREIEEGIKAVGILEMEIYILGNRLVMMHQGNAILDKKGEEKVKMSVDDILALFNEISIECGN